MVDLTNFIYFRMRTAMRKIDKTISSQLEPFKISIPQSFILTNLLATDGLTLKEIGIKSLIDSSSMTVLVDKLEKDGMVERRLDSHDRRAIRVFITPKGKDVAAEVIKISIDFNDNLYDLVGEGNQKEFIHGLSNIINQL